MHTDIWKYASFKQYREMLLSFGLLAGPDWPESRVIPCLYALSNHPEAHYRTHVIPKRGGGVRRLYAPDPLLKGVQRNLLRHLLEGFAPSQAAMAYRRGISLKDNAALHCGRRVVLGLDIRDFFDSITFPMVLGRAFPLAYFPRPVGVLLTSLCCLKERLPQGAPTSPYLSNLVMKPFDEHMLAWCRERDIAYSRYCDDMTFSGDFDPAEVRGKVSGFLEAMGMELNREKTKVQFSGSRQMVTGLVANDASGAGPSVPREYRRTLRREMYQYLKFGPGPGEEDCGARLLGQAQYVLSIHPEDAWLRQAAGDLQANRNTQGSIPKGDTK